MATKADELDGDLDKLGQNTVIGEDMKQYFRKDYCIYLTKTMFKYLNLLSVSLTSQLAKGKVSVYMIASLSALIRLVKINLRCLAICKVDLDQLVSKEECQNFEQMRVNFGS